MHPLALEALSLRSFRNLGEVDLAPAARFNVIGGDNGQGKTNLLEAIYAVATSRSFRTAKPGELVAHGGEVASVRVRVREDEDAREQVLGLKVGGRAAKIDGKRPASLADYAVRTPVVVFHPGEIALSMGSGGERRRLLDRLALFVRPGVMDDLDRYVRAMRARQRVLEARGVGATDAPHWEELMARHGVAIMDTRDEGARRLSREALAAFERIAAPGLAFSADYAPAAPRDEGAFREALAAARAVDLRRGGARVGPHRDDLSLSIGGRPARGIASQGQHRAAVLALKSAELRVIGAARGARPILLLDDVSSELDRARTAALFGFLREQQGQVFLTTTRPELIEIERNDRMDFRVESGRVSRV